MREKLVPACFCGVQSAMQHFVSNSLNVNIGPVPKFSTSSPALGDYLPEHGHMAFKAESFAPAQSGHTLYSATCLQHTVSQPADDHSWAGPALHHISTQIRPASEGYPPRAVPKLYPTDLTFNSFHYKNPLHSQTLVSSELRLQAGMVTIQ